MGEQSQSYHCYLKELQKYQERMGFEYFGLPKDATEKQLDNAYRSLAKKMHPDKNGGTEEAKKRFQNMKDRYDKLKKVMQEGGPNRSRGEDDERPADVGPKSAPQHKRTAPPTRQEKGGKGEGE